MAEYHKTAESVLHFEKAKKNTVLIYRNRLSDEPLKNPKLRHSELFCISNEIFTFE